MNDDDRRPAPTDRPLRVTPELVLVEGGLYRVDQRDVRVPDGPTRGGSDDAVEDAPPDAAA